MGDTLGSWTTHTLPPGERRDARHPPETARRRVYLLLNGGRESDIWARVVGWGIIGLIALNVLSVILESVHELHFAHGPLFETFDAISVAVFSLEYVLRVWTAPEDPNHDFKRPVTGRLRYLLTPMALIDLIAVLPFYLSFVVAIDLRFMRVLRILRVFKLTRYSSAMTLLLGVLRREVRSFTAALFVLALLMILSASFVYLFEHEAQPEAFANIPKAMWWAIITLTTIGYGDVYPITPAGQIFGGMIAVIGVGMVALPAGIIASGFSEQLRLHRKEYETVVDEALKDGELRPEEVSALTHLRDELGLSDDEVAEILRAAAKRGGEQTVCPHCGGALPVADAAEE